MIINWGEKSKKVCDASIDKCANCHNLSTFELRATENTAGLFFISLAKWGKKYWLVCQTCSAGLPISEGKENDAIKLFTEAPDHQTSLDIFRAMSRHFIEGNYMSSEEKLNQFLGDISEKLKDEGYREKDILYIYPVLLKQISAGVNAGKNS